MGTDGRRVVVTGMGALCPCGHTVEESWKNISSGVSGLAKITAFDTEGFSTTIGGEVKDFDPLEYIDRKEAKRMDRFVHLAVAASKEAMETFQDGEIDGENIATIIGSGIGGIHTFEKQHGQLVAKGPGKISPFFIPMMISDMASGLVSIRYGLKGPNYCTVSACASGGNGIATSLMLIKNGYCEAALTGGAEATISPMALGGFCSMKALSTRNDDPERASRPFDIDRDGFVMSEGAGIILLEELGHARARGAEVLAELVGVGMSGDAYHMTSPPPGGWGAIKSMKMALADAGIEPDRIDYINAHGTSTEYNDKSESEAIIEVFGDRDSLHVSSTKSTTGHLLGAAAGIEAIVCVKSLQEQLIPPTANLDNIDPACPVNHVPREAMNKDLEYVLSNSFGFGGHNVSLLFKRYSE